MDYQSYKLRVLAKTNGCNVHTVNGLLGIVYNGEENRDYWLKKDNIQEAKESQELVDKATREIYKMTGVSR